MKPAIGYAIVRHLWGSDYGVLAITTRTRRGLIYGQWVHNDAPTIRATRDVVWECATLGDAEAVLAAARDVDARLRGEIEAADALEKHARECANRLESQRRQSLTDAIRAYARSEL